MGKRVGQDPEVEGKVTIEEGGVRIVQIRGEYECQGGGEEERMNQSKKEINILNSIFNY